MKVVKKINKKDNASYIINEDGDIVEIEEHVKIIGKIDKRPNHKYSIKADGSIVEQEIVKMSMKDFYSKKASGELKKIIREGKAIEVIDNDLPLAQLEKFEDDYLTSKLEGATIEKVEIKREKGNRAIELTLSNGIKLILREGLLTGSTAIEIKE